MKKTLEIPKSYMTYFNGMNRKYGDIFDGFELYESYGAIIMAFNLNGRNGSMKLTNGHRLLEFILKCDTTAEMLRKGQM